MTASELYAMVRRWPREAWPEDLDYRKGDALISEGWYLDGLWRLHENQVAALFRDSGLAWLLSRAIVVGAHYEHQDGRTSLTCEGAGMNWREEKYRGPTLLHAIDAAIRGVGK